MPLRTVIRQPGTMFHAERNSCNVTTLGMNANVLIHSIIGCAIAIPPSLCRLCRNRVLPDRNRSTIRNHSRKHTVAITLSASATAPVSRHKWSCAQQEEIHGPCVLEAHNMFLGCPWQAFNIFSLYLLSIDALDNDNFQFDNDNALSRASSVIANFAPL
jgi:hypothetical protein